MGRKKHLDAIEPILQDNSKLGVGGFQYRIIFPSKEYINRLIQDIIDRKYKEDIIGEVVLQRTLPLMHIFNGMNDTSYRQAKRSGRYPLFTLENTISEFEERLALLEPEDRHVQLLGIYYAYYYNSVRSTIGNLKSNKQKERVVEIFQNFKDPRLSKALMLGEFEGYRLDPKSDGILHCKTRLHHNQSHIHLFLRIGDSIGGSQGDRMGQIKSVAEKYPDTDFILIWDGLEVDHQKIEQLNYLYSPSRVHGKGNAVYITTSDDISEDLVLELFDRR